MRKFLAAVSILVPAILLISACGGGDVASGGATPKPTPSSVPAAASPSASPAAPAAPAAPSAGDVPVYQPATVLSQVAGHTQLSSPSAVSDVTAFYQRALSENGWSLTSSAKTSASANFVATRTGEGATVAISTTGPSGTSISISTYSL